MIPNIAGETTRLFSIYSPSSRSHSSTVSSVYQVAAGTIISIITRLSPPLIRDQKAKPFRSGSSIIKTTHK